jgi:hypothetical protein
MSISKSKKLDNLTVLKIGLSAVERLQIGSSDEKRDGYLAEIYEICYQELCKRRREEKNKFKRILYDASDRELIDMARENEAKKNPHIPSACYNEILWRRRLEELRGQVEIKTALQKLDELLSD